MIEGKELSKVWVRGFTLVEILTVIGVMALIAALLFPVFIQAKEAAKAATTISNFKQMLLAYQMYSSDDDDVGVPRANQRGHYVQGGIDPTDPWGWMSWKQNLYVYTRSSTLFADPANPAARYPDCFSDPTWSALTGDTAMVSPYRMVRGYPLINSNFTYWTSSPSADPVSGGVEAGNQNFGTPDVVVPEPASIGLIGESKNIEEDFCPCLPWSKDASEGNPSEPSKNLGPNWGGGKWGDKAFVAGFFDGHAKRLDNAASCGRQGAINFWGYDTGSSEYAANSWWGTFCKSLPAAYQ